MTGNMTEVFRRGFKTAFIFSACLCASSARAAELSVLFLGNSFTSVNDLPRVFSEVAASRGDRAVVGMYAPGGGNLEQLAKDEAVPRLLRSKHWDFVVLQEQSQRPSFDRDQVSAEVVPAALKLDALVRAAPSRRTVFYETWGRKDGDASNCAVIPGVCTYEGMQRRLSETYAGLARRTSAVLSPVGRAWQALRLAHPDVNLYAGDGIHPSPQGTYLAACVFYAALFHKSPVGAGSQGLSGAQARLLQEGAAAAVPLGR